MFKVSINKMPPGWFWLWICRFAFRRITGPQAVKPVGIPCNRDPENICTAFAPRKRETGDFDCEGDGHYLCSECAFRSPTDPIEKEEEELEQQHRVGDRPANCIHPDCGAFRDPLNNGGWSCRAQHDNACAAEPKGDPK